MANLHRTAEMSKLLLLIFFVVYFLLVIYFISPDIFAPSKLR